MGPTRRPKHRRRSVPCAAKTTDSCLSSPRSSATSCTSSNSSSSSSGCSVTAATACTQQSPSFRCLEQISIDMTVDEEKSAGSGSKTQAVYYVMHVRHAKCGVTWSHRRSFDAYHAFHAQLMLILKQGHACHGDCPWLYSFLASYFPKSSSCPFKIFCPKLIAKRREALLQCFTTLLTFLLTRENQNCDVLRSSVLKAFITFVYGELGPSHPLVRALKINERLATEAVQGLEAMTLTPSSSTEEEDDASTFSSSEDTSSSSEGSAPACPLCRNRLDEDAAESITYPIHPLSRTRARAQTVSVSASAASSSSSSLSSSSSSSLSRYYATKLRCGHEFHEECILQWLNQELNCPVCGRSELSPRRSDRAASSSCGSGSFSS